MELYQKARSAGVNAYIVHDAGRTQVAAGSATVLAVGPGLSTQTPLIDCSRVLSWFLQC